MKGKGMVFKHKPQKKCGHDCLLPFRVQSLHLLAEGWRERVVYLPP